MTTENDMSVSDRRTTRRSFLGWSAAGAVGAVSIPGWLAACAGNSSTSLAPAKETDHLTMWIQKYYVPAANQVIEAAAQAAAQKGGFTISIEWLPFDNSSYAKWSAVLEANQLPDIGMAPGYPAEYWAMGKLSDVSDLVSEIGKTGGGWFDYALKDPTIKGKQYWVPLFNETAFGYFRNDMFEAAGYKTPIEDLDTLLEAGKAATKNGFYALGFAMSHGDWAHNVLPVLWAFGASLQDSKGQVATDRPEFLRAITWYTDLDTKWKVVPPGAPSWTTASNNQAYDGGQIAFASNPGSILNELRTDHKDVLAKTVLGTWAKKGSNGPFAATNIPGLFVTSTSKAPQRARAVIKSIMSPEFYPKFLVASNTNFLPVLKSYVDLPFFKNDPQNEYIVTQILPKARVRWWPFKATPTFAEVDSQVLWGKLLQRITVDHWDPKKAVDEFTASVKQIDDKYRKLYPHLYE